MYSGKLVIYSDTITIDGYGEDWKALVRDDSKRPFRELPKGVPLPRYSEEGKLFIEYPTSVLKDIPYNYTETWDNSNKVELLSFTFGERPEILRRKEGS